MNKVEGDLAHILANQANIEVKLNATFAKIVGGSRIQ